MKNEEVIQHIDKTLDEMKSKGLKAQTFLEWNQQTTHQLIALISSYTSYDKEKCNALSSQAYHKYARKSEFAINLYSQPFKPEMITEYFEGWEDINNNEIYSHQNSNNTYFTVVMRGASYDYYFKIYKNDNTELARHEFNNIQIIDNFISDCNRAGIKLTWKPEIVEKYFK